MVDIDYEAAALVVAWTVAFVAGVRARVPRINGWLVLPVALVGALLCSAVLLHPALPPWVRYGFLGLVGAVGGVSFKDRLIGKIRGDSGAEASKTPLNKET